MNIEHIETENAPKAIGPYSQAVKVNSFIYLSGQIALTSEGGMVESDIELQTHQVCENIKAVLEAAGVTMEDVVKTTVYLANMNHFTKMNEIYGEYFISKPARGTVQVARLPKDALVEIEVIAKA